MTQNDLYEFLIPGTYCGNSADSHVLGGTILNITKASLFQMHCDVPGERTGSH